MRVLLDIRSGYSPRSRQAPASDQVKTAAGAAGSRW